MLIKFTVKNFGSFKDEVSLNMNKLLANSKNNHATKHINKNTTGGFETLKAATIYGANASGKTNLIQTIFFLTNWASGKLNIDSKIVFSNDTKISNKFLLDDSSMRQHPSCFSIEFNTDKKAYRYSIDILDGLITKESLKQIYSTKEDQIIFLREYDNKAENYNSASIGEYYKIKENLDEVISAIKISDSNQPMLSQFLERSFSAETKKSTFFQDIGDAISWLKNDNISYRDGKPGGKFFELMEGNNDFKAFLLDLVQKYDLGTIYDISNDDLSDQEKDSLYSKFPPLKDLIFQLPTKDKKKQMAFLGFEQERYLINKESNETVTIKSLRLVRKNSDNQPIAFNFSRESQGTAKIIDLAMFFYQGFNKNKTIIIDEAESSLHTVIIRDLLDSLLNNEEMENVQFIITTHSESLFDLNLFRGDEIWLMNKKNDGSSCLNSLSDFKDKNNKNIRYDKKILNDYLRGRYGGIPRI